MHNLWVPGRPSSIYWNRLVQSANSLHYSILLSAMNVVSVVSVYSKTVVEGGPGHGLKNENELLYFQ